MASEGALEDITVLDLSHALAGPLASTLLADFGARVIKAETPGSGDIARHWGPPFYGDDSAYFVALNRNKKSVEIDLKHAQGKDLFFRLLERSDVLVENFRVGAMERLGIDYPSAAARHPGIVYCSISGFGQTGPYRDRPAMDLIVQAESGMIGVTGEEGGRGVRCGVSIADMTAGMSAAPLLGQLTDEVLREQSGWPRRRSTRSGTPARLARCGREPGRAGLDGNVRSRRASFLQAGSAVRARVPDK